MPEMPGTRLHTRNRGGYNYEFFLSFLFFLLLYAYFILKYKGGGETTNTVDDTSTIKPIKLPKKFRQILQGVGHFILLYLPIFIPSYGNRCYGFIQFRVTFPAAGSIILRPGGGGSLKNYSNIYSHKSIPSNPLYTRPVRIVTRCFVHLCMLISVLSLNCIN